ncbi:MAG TPA: hypothetical protein VFC07_09790, partial [Verrucomicrobiae bacterium]|nr:hypothetical protein [Verrucomicrobiae bacterium]
PNFYGSYGNFLLLRERCREQMKKIIGPELGAFMNGHNGLYFADYPGRQGVTSGQVPPPPALKSPCRAG